MKNKIITTILILAILSLNFISSATETYFTCGGDEETTIACSYGDEENYFFGSELIEEIKQVIFGGGAGSSGEKTYVSYMAYFIVFVILPLFILLLLMLWYITRKSKKR